MSKANTVGVVIGRFQTHELHEGHLHLINYVRDRHEKVLILVGDRDARPTPADPYPFSIRKDVLSQPYPDVLIERQLDSSISNQHWSSSVDAKVAAIANGSGAVLYGSRDSFIPYYTGVYPVAEVPELPNCSATRVRHEAATQNVNDPMWRKGWLAALHHQYAVTDPTVDMAVHTADWDLVLMGRRSSVSPLRFFGGFVNPEDASMEEAAKRELSEEAVGALIGEPRYVGSFRINDRRYQRSQYGIMTTFFAVEYKGGVVMPGDDMGVVEWCRLDEETLDKVALEHQKLFRELLVYKNKQSQ